MKSVLVIGDTTMDVTILVESYPPPLGGSSTCPAPILEAGGSAANVALALLQLGVRVSLVSKLGNDLMGRWVRDYLANEGVDVERVYSGDTYTPLILVLVDPNGERSFIACTRGSSQSQLQLEELQSIDLSSFHWLHVTGIALIEEPTRSSVLRIMQNASSRNIPISLDLNLRREYHDVDAGFRESLRFAADLSRFILGSSEEVTSTLPDMISDISRSPWATKHILVTRHGSGGAAATSEWGSINVPAYQVEVASTKGAGDAFDAGFIFAQLEGQIMETTLHWGNATAALTLSSPGPFSPPTKSQVEGLVRNGTTYPSVLAATTERDAHEQ